MCTPFDGAWDRFPHKALPTQRCSTQKSPLLRFPHTKVPPTQRCPHTKVPHIQRCLLHKRCLPHKGALHTKVPLHVGGPHTNMSPHTKVFPHTKVSPHIGAPTKVSLIKVSHTQIAPTKVPPYNHPSILQRWGRRIYTIAVHCRWSQIQRLSEPREV